MKNFDLKKYLAENKLLNEEETDKITAQEQIANALKIHFKTAYETGLEAQPEDGYSSFDKKYWKNNEADIINTLENTKVNIGENIEEDYKGTQKQKAIALLIMDAIDKDFSDGGAIDSSTMIPAIIEIFQNYNVE